QPVGEIGTVYFAAHASGDLADRLLPGACDGTTILTAAFEEDLGTDLTRPSAVLTTVDDELALSGVKVNIPYAGTADALLVSATGPNGPVVVAVGTRTPGVTIVPTPSTGLTPTYQATFDGVAVPTSNVLAGRSSTVIDAANLLRLGVAADQAGVVAAALDATATYAREREQFGRPIGSFQAVAQRLADAYIDVQGLSLTTVQAAWLTSSNASRDEISAAVATAKFWAAEAGHRVAHTTVHVHGGVGLDTSHPVHRFFLRATQNEFTYGSSPVALTQIGTILAGQCDAERSHEACRRP
ncbi:MAG: acyl-CoA dehydrogenase, partial [Gordonia sp. (in: high G+C Gram-positive bacteria)]